MLRSRFEAPQGKIKTRGSAATEFGSSKEIDNNPLEETDLQPKFKVSKKIAKVFSTFFHTVQTADPPGEIPWIDFLAVIFATAFPPPSKLYASLGKFAPTRLDVERST